MSTRMWTTLGATGMVIAVTAGCGMHQPPPPPAPLVVSAVEEKPGAIVEKGVLSVAARVMKVDQKTRVVTLKNAHGEEFDVLVGDEVKNLAQVKKGDNVVATYYESIALTLRKPGEAEPGIETNDAVGTAKPGEMPAAGGVTQTTITATVVGLNKKKGTITLKGPRGKVVTITAREPKRLEPVKVGDLIEAVYTEAVAISVEKPDKP